MADTISNQPVTNSSGGQADSPWNEPVPEVKPTEPQIGNLVNGDKPKGTPSQPFNLPKDIAADISSSAAQPALPTNSTSGFDYGFKEAPASTTPTVTAPAPAAAVPIPAPAAIPIVSATPAPVTIPPVASLMPQPNETVVTPEVEPSATAPKSLDSIYATSKSVSEPVATSIPAAPVAPVPIPLLVNKPVSEPAAMPEPVTPSIPTDSTVAPVPTPTSPSPTNVGNVTVASSAVSGTSLTEKKKFNKRSLYWIIPFILIVIFFLLTILTETGLISIGFEKVYGAIGVEKLWGGLPGDSEGALVRSFAAMKTSQELKADGTIYMNLDKSIKNTVTTPFYTDNSSAATTLTSATTDATSTTATTADQATVDQATADIPTTKAVNTTVTGSFGKAGNQFTLNVDKPVGTDVINLKNNGSSLWVQSDNILFNSKTETGKWLLYNLSPLQNDNISGKVFSIDPTKGFSTDGARLGSEKVDNIRCFTYELKNIQIGDAFSNIGLTNDKIQNASGTVWIGVKDKLVRRIDLKIIMAMSQPIMQMNISLNLTGYGSENSFAEPTSDQVFDPNAPSDTAASATSN